MKDSSYDPLSRSGLPANLRAQAFSATFFVLNAVFAWAILLAPGAAMASKAKAASQSSAVSKKAGNKVTYRPSPSEENRRERERRLERECRNKPNSGACTGFGYGARR